MTKNKLHVFLWNIRSKFITKKHTKLSPLEDRVYLMQAKIDFAKMFGGVKLFFLGDSNGANLDYDDVSEFKPVAVNFSLGGTTFSSWVKFFKSQEGAPILKQIKESGAKICVNLGGNHILQGSMGVFDSAFDEFFSMLPEAYYVTIPQIHSSIFTQINPQFSTEEINSAIRYCNEGIKRRAGLKTIDIYPLTTINGTEPIWVVHEDLVHFSQFYDEKVRIPFLKKSLGA